MSAHMQAPRRPVRERRDCAARRRDARFQAAAEGVVAAYLRDVARVAPQASSLGRRARR